MSTVKEEVERLLKKMPDTCAFEDVQYHLQVIEKIRRGIKRAETEGAVSQDEVEKQFIKWTKEQIGHRKRYKIQGSTFSGKRLSPCCFERVYRRFRSEEMHPRRSGYGSP